MKKSNSIVKGSVLLGAGAFISKLLGALYRIPLTDFLGGNGLGLYQMIFPVYAVLLEFSGAGVPNALSKMISGYENNAVAEYSLFYGAKKRLIILGGIGTLFMAVFSYPIAMAQGDYKAFIGYIALSPSVFLVAVLSCYRGYFQGKKNMAPTAVSQIIEQSVKLAAGLFLVWIFSFDVSFAVGGATLGVTLSELIAVIFMTVLLKRKTADSPLFFDADFFKSQEKKLFKYTVLVTVIGIAIPLSQVIDSFLIINILSSYREDATALYGLFSGAVNTIINLPVSVCYGVAAVAVPFVSGAKGKDKEKTAAKTLVVTLILSVPCALICYFFPSKIISFLFKRLSGEEFTVTVEMLKISSVCVVLLSLLQTENAVLIGKGKPQYSLIGMGVGIIAKTVINAVLLKNPDINVFASVWAVIACYFLAVMINFIMIKLTREKDGNKETEN